MTLARPFQSFRAVFQGLEISLLIVPMLGNFATAQTNAPLALSLQGAVQLALLQNRDLAKLAAMHETALLDRAGAETDFSIRTRPNGGVSSTGGIQTRQLGLDLVKKSEWGSEVEIGGTVSRSDIPDSDFAARDSVHITLSQPLLRYAGKLMNREGLERASSRIRTALRSLELKKADVTLQVIQAYAEIEQLEAQTAVEQATLARLDKLQRLTQVRAQQGRATKVDVLRVESQRGDAELRARSVSQRAAALRLDLVELLGLAPCAAIQLAPRPMLAGETQAVEAAVTTAWSNRLDLAQVQQDYRDVERGLRIARHMLLPDLKLVTTYERYGEGPTVAGASGFDQGNWSIGLQSGSELGTGKEHIAYRQAQLDERTAGDDIETTRRLIERQVRQQWLELTRAQAEIGLALRNRTVAESRLRLARRLFEMGRGDNFSVTDAEQQFQSVETAWLAAQTEAAVAGYRLRRIMGTLIECPEELKPEIK
ncbi:MAG: TolC family protein [Verrucomicrobia bacterium]|nr:MAG: TolC family protein [Verrucomicrobiota bacterium]